jgi:uncharacterized protein YbjT (DUF2867 family)
VPPNFDPEAGLLEARAIGAALRSALEAARPKRVVYLSTIGAQASQPKLLTQHTTIEQALSDLPMPIIFLRPAWFMENYRWDDPGARARKALTKGGSIEFESGETGSRKEGVSLQSVLQGLIQESSAH